MISLVFTREGNPGGVTLSTSTVQLVHKWANGDMNMDITIDAWLLDYVDILDSRVLEFLELELVLEYYTRQAHDTHDTDLTALEIRMKMRRIVEEMKWKRHPYREPRIRSLSFKN